MKIELPLCPQGDTPPHHRHWQRLWENLLAAVLPYLVKGKKEVIRFQGCQLLNLSKNHKGEVGDAAWGEGKGVLEGFKDKIDKNSSNSFENIIQDLFF